MRPATGLPPEVAIDIDAVRSAAQRLAAGGLVAFPTETVYGLGARADDDRAVAAIFAAKGRPADHPLIVHVAAPVQAAHFASELGPIARRLMAAFWPGPLTLIVQRAPGVAEAAAGGHATIGLRCPAHPLAQALLVAAAGLGVPGVAAPSANRFGRISPTTAQHVRDEFGDGLCLLDGGPCSLGIESAIVDCRGAYPVLLRPGTLPRAAIESAAGAALRAPEPGAAPAPGSLASHYAPRARLRLLPTQELAREMAAAAARLASGSVAVYSRTAPAALGVAATLRWQAMPDDAALAARSLFASLRALDAPGTQAIWVEQPPDAPEWEGVADRLRRAASA